MNAASATLYEELRLRGVIPVLTVNQVTDAAPLARALAEGGLPVAEVTFRTPGAADVLRVIAGTAGILAGAGTVRDPGQVAAAVAAGARFIVSPGWSETVFDACQRHGVPLIPGTATASDMQRASEHGIDVVKLFPAEAMGGLAAVDALAGPFGDMRFVPTGGIREDTAAAYLAHRAVLAVGGSWMVPAEMLRAGNWAEISRLAARAAGIVADAGSHV